MSSWSPPRRCHGNSSRPAISEAGGSLIGNANLITKIYFPRLIIPASSVITSAVDFLISFVILIGFMAWYRVVPGWQFATLPLFTLWALLAALGPGLMIAALNVKYRDFRYVVPFIVQFGIYVSPVGYASAIVTERLHVSRLLYSLNPVVGVIDGFRWAVSAGGEDAVPGRAWRRRWRRRWRCSRSASAISARPKRISPMSSEAMISIERLGKEYALGATGGGGGYTALRDVIAAKARGLLRRTPRADTDKGDASFWALRNVSFDVQPGEVVGIIGRNGAGKSTLLKTLSRITEPTEGRIHLRGRVASLLEVGTGFHPELTGRENIYLTGAILGMSRSEISAKFDEIVAFAEVAKFLDTPVKRYSSGMYVRLAFAVAAHLEPEILVVDEVLAVGDAEFQKKCLGKMQDVSPAAAGAPSCWSATIWGICCRSARAWYGCAAAPWRWTASRARSLANI